MNPLQILATLLTLPSLTQAKANLLAIAQAAGLNVMVWIFGSPSERWIEIAARAMDAWGTVPAQAVKGFFLDLATDPGDPGDVTPDQTPRAGWLSALGQGWYGTTRGGRTYAASFVTITNPGGSPITFGPGQITVQRNTVGSDGASVTYRNTADPSLYVNIGGTITIGGGGSAVLPFQADQIGSYASALLNAINEVQTTTYGTLTATASTVATGLEREDPVTYRARCRANAASLAPGGPLEAYLVAMNTAKDGTPLQRFNGSGPVTITQAYVSPSSSTGNVILYFGNDEGTVDDIDVSSANANITGIPLGVITNPRGVMPDTTVIGPATNDPNTGGPGGVSCIDTPIAVTYSAKIRASQVPNGAAPGTYTSGGSPPASVAAIFTTIAAAIGAFLPAQGIGGVDRSAGSGFVYTPDIQDAIKDSVAGLYVVTMTLPSATGTGIAVGHCPVAGAILGTLAVVAG